MDKFIRPTFEIIHESDDKRHCIVAVEPLERGLGVTLGNSLRRVLLSSIPGVAAYAVKFHGARHEFSTIPNVLESIPNIIINIKNLVVKPENLFQESKEEIVLKIENATGEVKAGNIKCPTGFSITNPDLHIATVTEGKTFSGNIYVAINRGFVLFTKNKLNMKKSEGMIAIDSNYSPVKNVKVVVEETRIGKVKDLEKLTLEIETNGAITAKKAVAFASKVVIEHLNEFANWASDIQAQELIVDQKETEQRTFLSSSLIDLDLTVRPFNALKQQGIERIEQLCEMSLFDLNNIKNLGKKSVEEIIEKLDQKGLKLRQE
ncbi:hypothetical protein ASO20_01965 [Mycoplasma sp. (ex Biomphalaria glabrata)]|uniref:DNA-directed RNA polymerase subunit alpha n=1 Tax=Mycoplasma sp. (ex Biomphalaria glabrata) TaxID=1749074 RepID=UPI00073A78E8|nr:DNA-directed RNA polymerase subunit alpha [Mycoplasma sp. (ex Biomphalaria glabrata)]ALV23411.1 hypothetical protein ASO20_01965 [Mycoplasma sp. (ex Biomphalaria glabrata)]